MLDARIRLTSKLSDPAPINLQHGDRGNRRVRCMQMLGVSLWCERLLETEVLKRYLKGIVKSLGIGETCDVFCVDAESIYNLANLRCVWITCGHTPKAIQ